MQLPGEQWWMRCKNLVKSIAQTCQEGQRGQNCQISVWSSCGAGFGFCPHQRQIKNNEEYKKWVKLTYYTFFANRVSPFFKLSTKFRENWLTNMCKRSLYTCLSRPLKGPIFCHLTWQLDKSQNWESLPTLCASEISRLICDFIKSFGFMSKILPNFRGKSKLLTFLLSSANIGNFFTQFNHGHEKYILLAFIWVHFQNWCVPRSVQKLRSKLARKHKLGWTDVSRLIFRPANGSQLGPPLGDKAADYLPF